ncbi:MAG: carboxypeptidase-like regulatory domain-containing protein, partial [Flammeovirgaceae bacterium]
MNVQPYFGLICLIILFNLNHTFAQSEQIHLSGKVLSAKDNSPLPYAYVQIQGIPIGTVTDHTGSYSLFIPEKYAEKQLDFFYLGYKKQSFQINRITNQSNFIVKLEESTTLLSEVVIEPRKEISAKKLWKKVIKNISKNYPQTAINMEAYYRETIRENDAYMKYADAACQFHLAPYS